MKIDQIDQNFKVQGIQEASCQFYDLDHPAFVLEGLPFSAKSGPYQRLPREVCDTTREGLRVLASHTSGGALRFCTDSGCLALDAQLCNLSGLGHMPLSGECGFDLYEKTPQGWRFLHSFHPKPGETAFQESFPLPAPLALTEYLLYFPLYSGVSSLRLALSPQARLATPPARKQNPIAFYGSSITQGACASRPGLCYPALLGRALDAPIINLGFSGNAWGDLEIAQVIAQLDLSAFVLDYDYNASSADFLARTHAPFFSEVRRAQPALPILLLSRVLGDIRYKQDAFARRDTIFSTWRDARAHGDEHVFFLNGMDFWEDGSRGEYTLDLCHPNDRGFFEMAEHILSVLRDMLEQ